MFNVFSLLSLSVPARLLDAFRVVCVSPSTPGNVGMIARAVANFEAGGLTLVAPGARVEPEPDPRRFLRARAVAPRP
jgi:tRNA C32,U32 (ribose-2'-O)-methylase TrmJ